MTLAGNLLNAIGGKPDLSKPGFLLDYPNPLSGTIEEGLIKSFSMDLRKRWKNAMPLIRHTATC